MQKILIQLSGFVYAAFLLCGATCHAQWNAEELRFPHHYSELIGSIQRGEKYVGANYTYIPKKWGFYGSFLYGFGERGFGANVGPVIRLTDSRSTSVDIQLFLGTGLNSHEETYTEYFEDYSEKHSERVYRIAGETGIRFGFGRDKKYGMWSLSGALNYSSDGLGLSAGVSWPIAGITAASALVIGYAVLVAYSGGSVSVPSTVSSSSSSSGSTVSSGTGTNCDFWQNEYRKSEQIVEKLYNDIKDLQRTSPTQATLAGWKKNYRDAQKNLKKWRTNAKGKGCTISASVWETKSL